MTLEIREEYLTGNILEVGTIVEDIKTGETLTILYRGSNYITVSDNNGEIQKKWLTDVKLNENRELNVPVLVEGQVSFTGFNTMSLDEETAETLIDMYHDTEDKFAYRQALAHIDSMIRESNLDVKYDLIEKAEGYFKKMGLETPFLLDEAKSAVEQKRIAQLIASVADIEFSDTPAETVTKTIKKLKSDSTSKQQWEVLKPLFIAARTAGIMFPTGQLPFALKESEEEIIFNVISENLDLMVDDLDYDDLLEEFNEEELTEEILDEVLSIAARNKLSRGVRTRGARLTKRREIANKRAASVSTLMNRARRLANQMLKKRMFKKTDLSRAEKERYEAGKTRRKEVVARLAKRLLSKVRTIQNQRLHSNRDAK